MNKETQILIEKAIREIDTNKGISLSQCSGFVTYILVTLHYIEKENNEDINYSAIGGGIAQAFLHLSIDYKVVGQKFKLVDEYFDKTLDYINKDSKELASAMINYIASLKSSYYTNKYPYDMAAIYLFFERGRKQKLVCHINGENRIL